MKKSLCIIVVFVTGSFLPVFSQTKSLQIGIKPMFELTWYHGLAPGAGLQLVYRFGQHHGFETGINCQSRRGTDIFTEGSPGGGGPYRGEVFASRLLFPLLYRFNSTAINFTAGPVIDISAGGKIKTDDPDPALQHYKVYGTTIIASAGVSHSFFLSSSWIVEPEITFNQHLSNRHDGGLGLNIALRKIIF